MQEMFPQNLVDDSAPESHEAAPAINEQAAAALQAAVEKMQQMQQRIEVLEAAQAAVPVVEEKYVPAPWHIDPATKPAAGVVKNYKLLDAPTEDIRKVVTSYLRAPVPGYTIRAIKIVYNPNLNRTFGLEVHRLEARHGNPAFSAKWKNEAGASGEWRKTTHQILENMAAPHKDPNYPHVTLLPMWHATKEEILASIFSIGFVSLVDVDAPNVDPGYFGKGVYSAGEAKYSYTVYGGMCDHPALLMNWVATYSAYPVIDGDMDKLMGKGAKGNHDSHFIPVRPAHPNNPNEVNFFPCRVNEPYVYTELVVFNGAQCLPRYLVELQQDLLPTPMNVEAMVLKIKINQVANQPAQIAGPAENKQPEQAAAQHPQVAVPAEDKHPEQAENVLIPKELSLARAEVRPENVHSFLNMRAGLSYGLWQVALMRDTQSKQKSGHTFIVVEGLDAFGHCFFWRFDLATKIGVEVVQEGFAKVNIQYQRNVTPPEREAVLQKLLSSSEGKGDPTGLAGHIWQLKREKVLDLYRAMMLDQAKGLLPYVAGHSPAFFGAQGETCYAWARRHLTALEEPKIQQDLPFKGIDYFALPPNKWTFRGSLADAKYAQEMEKGKSGGCRQQ